MHCTLRVIQAAEFYRWWCSVERWKDKDHNVGVKIFIAENISKYCVYDPKFWSEGNCIISWNSLRYILHHFENADKWKFMNSFTHIKADYK